MPDPPAPPRTRPRTSTESRSPMPASTPPLPMPPAGSGARRAALSASALQPSGTPDAGPITAAITSAVQRSGPRGCAGHMAQQFGDHPGAAARRMRGARRLAAWHPARLHPSSAGRDRPGPVPVTPHQPPTYPRWSTTMPAPTRSPQSRPNSAPAYYLARPASWWITASRRRAQPCAGRRLPGPIAVPSP